MRVVILCLLLAGCTEDGKFAPNVQPTCLAFCFMIVNETSTEAAPMD